MSMRLRSVLIALPLLAISATAGEKKLMHCFAWTAVKEATPADWEAFYKASDALPTKIKGITKVWYGKLANPLSQTITVKVEEANRLKLRAGETAPAEVTRVTRQFGMCIEMADEAALKAYDTDPYHKIWEKAYEKVRVEGTITFDILGQ